MTDNEKITVVKSFYEAFSRLDAEAMVACYHEEVVFEDPAFGKLYGEEAKNMWRMLCASAQKDRQGKNGFELIYEDVRAYQHEAFAKWEAKYTFSKTKRPVHNKIKARFRFKDGLIVNHLDVFDLQNWARQALGFKGFLLGWTPFFKNKLQEQTKRTLLKYTETA